MFVTRLQCAMLYVKDFPRMSEFYGKMLRSKPVNTESTDSWALFDLGGTQFALHAIPIEYLQSDGITSTPEVRERSPIKLIFEVDDVRAERVLLEALGITMVQRPWQQPLEACDGIDPEGNVFQISAIRV